ncbi:MAG: hypothetical protein KGH71_05620 [Candidatus Micrarchaeota archaeon]|nr:hypothetical protein [Candidatus Micrarchaeota archaeon]
MRQTNFAFLLLISLSSILFAQSSSIASANYTSAYANQTVNQTLGCINQINDSGYLIFYPNLTSAYSYLSKAQQSEVSSPESAILYSHMAAAQAQSEYSKISGYKTDSFWIMVFLSLISLIWLFSLMQKRTRK